MKRDTGMACALVIRSGVLSDGTRGGGMREGISVSIYAKVKNTKVVLLTYDLLRQPVGVNGRAARHRSMHLLIRLQLLR